MHRVKRCMWDSKEGRSLYLKSLHKMRQSNVQNYYESLVEVASTKHGKLCYETFTRQDRRKANQQLRQIINNMRKGEKDYSFFLSKRE